MKKFYMDKDVKDLVKSIKRANKGQGSNIHFGFKDRAGDYIYFNVNKEGVAEFNMKHPMDYGCVIHLKGLTAEDMLFFAKMMKESNKAECALRNEDIHDAWVNTLGKEY